MLSTDADIIQRFNAEYSESIKNGASKRNLFEKVCDKIFGLYGDITGFPSSSSMQTFISNAKKKHPVITVNVPQKKKEEISEGSGLIFTLQQIEELGLDPESYL